LRLSTADVRALERRAWPGNVRELQSVMERAAILARGTRLDLDAALPPAADRSDARATTFRSPASASAVAIETEAERKRRERTNIEAALAAANGRIYGPDGAARMLAMKPTTLASRIKALGIRKPG